MAMNIVNVLEDPSTGKINQNQKGTGGAAHVADVGLQRLPHNRELASVTTRQSVTWQPGYGPVDIEIIMDGTGPLSAYVCFDAPNDSVADSWLADAGTSSTDTMRYFIADETIKQGPNRFQFSGELSRLDIIQVAGTIAKVYVRGE